MTSMVECRFCGGEGYLDSMGDGERDGRCAGCKGSGQLPADKKVSLPVRCPKCWTPENEYGDESCRECYGLGNVWVEVLAGEPLKGEPWKP